MGHPGRPRAPRPSTRLALKAANLELLVREEPAVETVVTYNAQVNDHMVAINDRLGFCPVERLGEFERRL